MLEEVEEPVWLAEFRFVLLAICSNEPKIKRERKKQLINICRTNLFIFCRNVSCLDFHLFLPGLFESESDGAPGLVAHSHFVPHNSAIQQCSQCVSHFVRWFKLTRVYFLKQFQFIRGVVVFKKRFVFSSGQNSFFPKAPQRRGKGLGLLGGFLLVFQRRLRLRRFAFSSLVFFFFFFAVAFGPENSKLSGGIKSRIIRLLCFSGSKRIMIFLSDGYRRLLKLLFMYHIVRSATCSRSLSLYLCFSRFVYVVPRCSRFSKCHFKPFPFDYWHRVAIAILRLPGIAMFLLYRVHTSKNRQILTAR